MSRSALVTGARGFAGRHHVEQLGEQGWEVTAPGSEQLDLLEPEGVRAAMAELRPGAVFHLAALASVGRSWRNPAESLTQNISMTLHLLEAVRREAPEAVTLVAGSGEVYGKPEQLPMDEEAPLRPQNPYAVSKAACDLLAGQYADSYGLAVLRTRAFNHAGPGQSEDYVIGTICRQVAEAEARGSEEAVLRMGNLDARRDFTDVRDVARAYVLSAGIDPGVYNICSGRSVSVRELVELAAGAARVPVRVELDPERVRASDVPEVVGSAERLRAATGWEPRIALERTVGDALDSWRGRLIAAG